MGLTQVSTSGIKNATIATPDIADNAVTFDKVQDIPEERLVGRVSSGSGIPEHLTQSEVITFLGINAGATNTTINNNAGNRVITGSGTANTLNAESNVIIDSNGLGVGGAPDFEFQVTDSSGAATIRAKDGANNRTVDLIANSTGGLIRTLGSYPLVLNTNQTERMRIDSNGQLLVGTTQSSAYGNRQLAVGDVANDGSFMEIRTSGTGTGHLLFSRTAGSNSGNYQGYIAYHQNTDHFSFHTGGGNQRARIDSDGLKFNADTAAATALDDYEEGTWTPSMSSGTANFTGATYVKIGKLVHVSVYANSFSDNTSGSVIQFNGLPFTSASDQRSTGAMLLAYVTTLDQSVAYIGGNVSNIRLYHYDSGGDYTSLNYSAITAANNSTRRIFIGMTYMAA